MRTLLPIFNGLLHYLFCSLLIPFLLLQRSPPLSLFLHHDQLLESQLRQLILCTEHYGSVSDLFAILHYPPLSVHLALIHSVLQFSLNLLGLPLPLFLRDLRLLVEDHSLGGFSHLRHVSLSLSEGALFFQFSFDPLPLFFLSQEPILLLLDPPKGLLLLLLSFPFLGCLLQRGWEGVLQLCEVVRSELWLNVVAS